MRNKKNYPVEKLGGIFFRKTDLFFTAAVGDEIIFHAEFFNVQSKKSSAGFFFAKQIYFLLPL